MSRHFLFGMGVATLFFLVVGVISSFSSVLYSLFDSSEPIASEGIFSYEDGDSCNVLAIKLEGGLVTYGADDYEGDATASDDIVEAITLAQDSGAEAIFLQVDSFGGTPVAGEEVAQAIARSSLPVVAIVRQTAASAAYLAISTADKIFASQYSDVGGIGVTMSYLNNVEKNKKEGYTYESLSSGKYKDVGSPDRALSEEERNLLLRDIVLAHEYFIDAVSVNRAIPKSELLSFADGSTMLGRQAKEVGLVDEIGGLYEAMAYIENEIGKKAVLCQESLLSY